MRPTTEQLDQTWNAINAGTQPNKAYAREDYFILQGAVHVTKVAFAELVALREEVVTLRAEKEKLEKGTAAATTAPVSAAPDYQLPTPTDANEASEQSN